MLLQETFVLEDLLYYNAELTKTFSSSSTTYENIVDLGSVLDCEITATINATDVHGLALIYKKENNANNTYYVRAGCGGGTEYNGAIFKSSAVSDHNGSVASANTDFSVKIKVSNGKVSIVSGNYTLTDYSVTGIDARYVGLFNWNRSKTITVKNLKVKAL